MIKLSATPHLTGTNVREVLLLFLLFILLKLKAPLWNFRSQASELLEGEEPRAFGCLFYSPVLGATGSC